MLQTKLTAVLFEFSNDFMGLLQVIQRNRLTDLKDNGIATKLMCFQCRHQPVNKLSLMQALL